MSAKHNLVCEEGATFTFNFTIKTGNTAWNLTSYTATMTVRPFIGSTTTTIVATNANGKIVLGGAAGTVAVTFNAATTGAFTPGKYVYDLVLDSGTVVTRLLEGKFVVTPSVTA
jgi:hypothetical protein